MDEWFILPVEQRDGLVQALIYLGDISIEAVYWYSCANRNSGSSDYCLIDPVLLRQYKGSHQETKAQSDTAHID